MIASSVICGSVALLAVQGVAVALGLRNQSNKFRFGRPPIPQKPVERRQGFVANTTSMIGPLGYEFVSTRWPHELSVGDVAPCRSYDQRALLVVGLEGLNEAGCQLYRLRVIEAPRA